MADITPAAPSLPRDAAQQATAELFEIIALMHALRNGVDISNPRDADEDNLMCAASRTVALAGIADKKARGLVQLLSAYC